MLRSDTTPFCAARRAAHSCALRVVSRGSRATILAAALACLLAGCHQIKPSHDRPWQPDQAVLPHAVFKKDVVKVYDIRNCNYIADEEYVLDYYDKTYRLDSVRSVDFLVIPFPDAPKLAHTMLSFGFDNDEYLAVSVEVRKKVGDVYDPVKGLFNEYELWYVLGDERDLVKLRTNFRNNETYLYRTKATPEQARKLFVDVLSRTNQIYKRPEFYNTLTNNCTTNVQDHVNRLKPGAVPYSIDILMPGSADRFLYDLGLLETPLPFEEARRAAHVNELAKQYADAPDFSVRIREKTLAARPGALLR